MPWLRNAEADWPGLEGIECYDWWSPGEIELLLVVMKKPGGARGGDNVTHTHTHLICPGVLRGALLSRSEANEGDPASLRTRFQMRQQFPPFYKRETIS